MEEIIVKVINRSGNQLPAYATKDSAGLDLRASLKEPLLISPFKRKLVPTGLFIEIPEGYEGQVRPRSGLALKTGLTVLNSPGTIDADYRGELGVILINLSEEVVEIKDGDRIAQLVISKYQRINWNNTEELSDSKRGKGGFGHTGNN